MIKLICKDLKPGNELMKFSFSMAPNGLCYSINIMVRVDKYYNYSQMVLFEGNEYKTWSEEKQWEHIKTILRERYHQNIKVKKDKFPFTD